MKSSVTHLYDYTTASIPEHLRLWRVKDEELDDRLLHLTLLHAREKEVETVQDKDSVVCRGESTAARWNRPVLLFYPGYGLCEQALENALVGMRVGENKTIATVDGDVTVTIQRILRGREPFPVCDDLVKLEKIEGVETLSDYRRWFREKTESQRRNERSIPIGQYFMKEVTEKSEVFINESEEAQWTWDWVDHICSNLAARGTDWKAGFGIDPSASDEEARQQLFASYREGFRNWVLFQALIERAGMDLNTVRREGMKEIMEYTKQTEDEILECSGNSAVDMSILMKQVKRLFLDYAKHHLDEILEE